MTRTRKEAVASLNNVFMQAARAGVAITKMTVRTNEFDAPFACHMGKLVNVEPDRNSPLVARLEKLRDFAAREGWHLTKVQTTESWESETPNVTHQLVEDWTMEPKLVEYACITKGTTDQETFEDFNRSRPKQKTSECRSTQGFERQRKVRLRVGLNHHAESVTKRLRSRANRQVVVTHGKALGSESPRGALTLEGPDHRAIRHAHHNQPRFNNRECHRIHTQHESKHVNAWNGENPGSNQMLPRLSTVRLD